MLRTEPFGLGPSGFNRMTRVPPFRFCRNLARMAELEAISRQRPFTDGEATDYARSVQAERERQRYHRRMGRGG